MDEADVLADRVGINNYYNYYKFNHAHSFFFLFILLFLAIMAEGEIQCLGTTMFLKKMYGINYYLNIEKGEDCIYTDVMGAICEVFNHYKLLLLY